MAEFGDGNLEAETHGVKSDMERSEVPMDGGDAAKFRRGAAKLNYMTQDRADLGLTSEEIARRMARPMAGDELFLQRAVRYLRRYPQWTSQFLWQEGPSHLTPLPTAIGQVAIARGEARRER